jgi:hypothetical protein
MPRPAKNIEEQLLDQHPELKARGLRPLVLWGPDTRDPAFNEELRQDFEAIRKSLQEEAVLNWIEQVSDWPKD